MSNNNCPICYDDIPQGLMIVCWNEHSLCDGCYKRQITPRRGGEYNEQINTNCPECREPMFDWISGMMPTRRRNRCGICREEGHNRTSCQDSRAVEARAERVRLLNEQQVLRDQERRARLDREREARRVAEERAQVVASNEGFEQWYTRFMERYP
jgi:hypothetical protein